MGVRHNEPGEVVLCLIAIFFSGSLAIVDPSAALSV
jgi:hypothetical protein